MLGGNDPSPANFSEDNGVRNCPRASDRAQRFFTRGGASGRVAAVEAGGTFYEVRCRGPRKCGTFVSVRSLDACPKCGSKKIIDPHFGQASRLRTETNV